MAKSKRSRTPEPSKTRRKKDFNIAEMKENDLIEEKHLLQSSEEEDIFDGFELESSESSEENVEDEVNDDDSDSEKEQKNSKASKNKQKISKPSKKVQGKPNPGFIQETGFIDAFYQPRSVSALTVLGVGVFYVSLWGEANLEESGKRLRNGLLLSAAAFLLYCMIQLRDGHLIRPHPALWRIAHGTGLIYFMILTYLLCQDMKGIHHFLHIFDETVTGEPEQDKNYADDCRLYIPNSTNPFKNVYEQVYDRFMVAHFLGWTLKALILRDWSLMWIASVLFEVLETSFGHMYPNFNECWWDHLLLDIFGCNFLGMILGMTIVKALGTHEFNWTGMPTDNVGKVKRVFLQFSPHSFEVYRWHIFKSWRHLVISVAVLSILLLGEMNAFFIKSTFNVPIKSDLNLYRLSFWVLMTYMAVFEFNWYANGHTKRIGINSWLATVLVSFETALVIKHTYLSGIFTPQQLWPATYIYKGWFATFILIFIVAFVKASRKLIMNYGGIEEKFDHEHKKRKVKSLTKLEKARPGAKKIIELVSLLDNIFEILTFAIPIPLLVVLALDCYRTTEYPPPHPGQGIW